MEDSPAPVEYRSSHGSASTSAGRAHNDLEHQFRRLKRAHESIVRAYIGLQRQNYRLQLENEFARKKLAGVRATWPKMTDYYKRVGRLQVLHQLSCARDAHLSELVERYPRGGPALEDVLDQQYEAPTALQLNRSVHANSRLSL